MEELKNHSLGEYDGADPTVAGSMLADPILTVADPTATEGLRARRAQVKLTSERLLAEKGLPWVLKNGPKRIRISRKKRSTYDNLNHIIQFYQLWAHELYPKAKFDDFIKLCHTLGKNDKVLRQFREDVFRKEMLGEAIETETVSEFLNEAIQEGSTVAARPVASPELSDEEELYSISRGNEDSRGTSKESNDGPDKGLSKGPELSEGPENESADYELEFKIQPEAQNGNDSFEEDEEALEVMKEMGF